MPTFTASIPADITPLSPNGFLFSIQKLPDISFFCQQVAIPGITLGAPEFNTPFSIIPIPGETLTYDQLQIQFLVDEKMENYKAIYNWIVALGFPESYDQYTKFIAESAIASSSELAKNFSDGTLTILTAGNQIAQQIQIHDMFPISIDSLVFQSTNSDVQYLVGSANFRYSYYKFI